MILSETPAGKKLMVCMKGEPGGGKTLAACSFPKTKEKKLYVFDLDGRMEPIIHSPFITDKDCIEYDTYTAQDYLKFRKKIDDILSGRVKYSTVVMDGLTSGGDMIIQYGIDNHGTDGESKLNMGVIELAGIKDYGGESRGLGQIIEFGRRIPSHFILTAHVLTIDNKDNTGKIVQTRTLLTAGKKIAAKIPVYFNEIWHFGIEDSGLNSSPPDYFFYTKNAAVDFAKTAFPLPYKIKVTDKATFPLVQSLLKAKGIEIG